MFLSMFGEYEHRLYINDKILEMSRLNVFADDKLNLSQVSKFFCETLEDIVRKVEYTNYQHYLFSRDDFKAFFPKFVKRWDCEVQVLKILNFCLRA